MASVFGLFACSLLLQKRFSWMDGPLGIRKRIKPSLRLGVALDAGGASQAASLLLAFFFKPSKWLRSMNEHADAVDGDGRRDLKEVPRSVRRSGASPQGIAAEPRRLRSRRK